MNEFEKLFAKIDYHFKDESLVVSALTHRSKGRDNNERLEFLGDSILSFVVAEALFELLPDASEGELSRLRSYLVKGETLAEIARELDLGRYLLLGQGELRSGGFRRDSILADSFEALIASVFLDSDMVACRSLVLRLFKSRLNKQSLSNHSKDPKTQLQEFLQAKKLPLPEYEVSEVSGEQHEQEFTIVCRVEKLGLSGVGQALNRRKAEKKAALSVLKQLKP